MGDPRRFDVFARNLYYKFPPDKYRNVLVVADGNLELSKRLVTYGYSVTAVEPKPRLKNVSNMFLKKIRLIKRWFTREDTIKGINLVIGMHPDEATVEILHYAKINEVAFAVVPCCILGDIHYTVHCHKHKDWIDRLKRINRNSVTEVLNIAGKNVMVYSGTGTNY